MILSSIQKSDLKEIIKIFNRKIGLLFICFLFLYLDSEILYSSYSYGQVALSFLTIIAFVFLYFKSVERTKKLMIYALIIGFIEEYFFSAYLNMYSYRLGNIPLYVPFGHAILYARVYVFFKSSLVKKHHKIIERFFYGIISLFALGYLYFFNDFFGGIMTLGVFLICFMSPKDRLCFLTMYIVVAVLEMEGTALGIWDWPNKAFGVFDTLPSHNPPSGISFFYFIVPIGCFMVYTQLNKEAWKRVKNIRKINKKFN